MRQTARGGMVEANYSGFSVIGRSPYATTYRAFSTTLEQVVILKVYRQVRDAKSGRKSATARFIDEIQAWAQAAPPHLLLPLEAGNSARGEAYLARPRLPLDSLAAQIGAGERFAIETAMALGEAMSRAVSALNDAGLVHGAVTPNNLLLAGAQTIWLSDPLPAIARELLPAGPGLRPGHIAPEVLAGDPFSPQSDSYSIMSTVAFALGHQPVPGLISDLVDAGLANEPQDRPTPNELVDLFAEAALDLATPRPIRPARPLPTPELVALPEIAVHPEMAVLPEVTEVTEPMSDEPAAEVVQEEAAQVEAIKAVEAAEATHEEPIAEVAKPAPEPRSGPLIIPINDLQASISERSAAELRKRTRSRRWRVAAAAAVVTLLIGSAAYLVWNRSRTTSSTDAQGEPISRQGGSGPGDSASAAQVAATDQVSVTVTKWFAVTGPRNQRQVALDLSASRADTTPIDITADSAVKVALVLGTMGDYSPPAGTNLSVADLGMSPAELGLEPPVTPVRRLHAVFINPPGTSETFANPVDGTPVTTYSSRGDRAVFYVPQPSEVLAVAILDRDNRILGVAASQSWGSASEPDVS